MPAKAGLLVFKRTALPSEEPGEYDQYINQHIGKRNRVAGFCSEILSFVSHAIRKGRLKMFLGFNLLLKQQARGCQTLLIAASQKRCGETSYARFSS